MINNFFPPHSHIHTGSWIFFFHCFNLSIFGFLTVEGCITPTHLYLFESFTTHNNFYLLPLSPRFICCNKQQNPKKTKYTKKPKPSLYLLTKHTDIEWVTTLFNTWPWTVVCNTGTSFPWPTESLRVFHRSSSSITETWTSGSGLSQGPSWYTHGPPGLHDIVEPWCT